MNRRRYLAGCGSLTSAAVAGCISNLPYSSSKQVPSSDVFARHWYDPTELVVEFQDDVDVKRANLVEPAADLEYESVDRPGGSLRFRVVFPNRLKTYLGARPGLRVTAQTDDGIARQSVWEPIHGVARAVEALPDGRARFDLENQGEAPLLVRFVGIYGDVPNPTIDPTTDSFDLTTFDLGPGVIGIGANRPLTPSRTDLVIPAGVKKSFETTYAPFSFPSTAPTRTCDGEDRTGMISIVPASGGSTAYQFTYQLDGEMSPLDGHPATVCDTPSPSDTKD